MSRTVPWSIDGVGAGARRAARDAAHRAGLSLGDWLDGIIAERAAELGVVTSDVDAHQRMEAVAAELARMSGRPAPGRDDDGGRDLAAPPAPVRPSARDGRGASSGLPVETLAPRDERESDRVGLADGPASPATLPSRPTTSQPFRLTKASGDVGFIRGAIAEIARRQADLDATFPAQGSPRPRDPAAVAPLETDGREWERSRAASRTPPFARDTKPATREPLRTAPLQDAVAAIESRLGAQAASPRATPRDDRATLRSQMARIDAPPSPVREDATDDAPSIPAFAADPRTAEPSYFERLAQDLMRAIEDIDARPSVRGLDRQVETLGRKIEAMTAGLGTGDALARIGEQTREVRELLVDVAKRPPVSEAVERQIAAIEAQVGTLARGSKADAGADPTLTEIRALLDRFRPGHALDTLERRVGELATRVEDKLGSGSLTLMEDLARRVDAGHAALRTQLAQSGRDTRPLEDLVRGVGSRIEDARQASVDLQGLEAAVRDLAAKFEDGRLGADARTLRALDDQFAKLGDRLEQSETSVAALDAVEHSLGELFGKLDEARTAAIEAAENAARTAARDTLRAAMQNPALGMRPGEGRHELAEQVSLEIAELRERQAASDQRLQATLSGFNRTLERLVGQASEGGEPEPRPAAPDRARVEAPLVRVDRDVRRPSAEAARPDPSDMLIEPNAVASRGGGPGGTAETDADLAAVTASPDEPPLDGPAGFIAAARRAAQVAQTSVAATKRPPAPRGAMPRAGRADTAGARHPRRGEAVSTIARARAFLSHRRRPLLLGIAGLVLVLGALEIAKVSFEPGQYAGLDAAEPGGSGPRTDQAGATGRPGSRAGDVTTTNAVSPKPVAALPPSSPLPSPLSSPLGAVPARDLVGGPVGSPGSNARALAPQGNLPAGASDGALAGLGEGLRGKAVGGDAAAQYEVALRFGEGRTVARDPKIAAVWFAKAADQGFAPAQYRLGSAYEKGVGVGRDTALAMAWYGRAAEAGNIRAMHNLAVMAAEGAGGKPDYAQAATWFGKAAAYGVRDSQFNLAILRARGLGIEQSLTEAYTWFAVAAGQGDEDAAKKRDEVGQHLDPKALGAAKAAADAFRPASANTLANEAPIPPGGWDAVAPMSTSRPSASGPGKISAPKVSAL